jgi:hypothetical protein
MKKKMFYNILFISLIHIGQSTDAYLAHSPQHTLDMAGVIAAGGNAVTQQKKLDGILESGNGQTMSSSTYVTMPAIHSHVQPIPLNLMIEAPLSGAHTEDSIVTIEGYVDPTDAIVKINDVRVPIVEGHFSYAYALQFDENTISVRAELKGEIVEKTIIIYREIGAVSSGEDMFMTVQRNFDKLQDLQATLISQDNYNNNAMVGTIWSKIYFKSPSSLRLESFSDAAMVTEYSTFVLNDAMLYNTSYGDTVHESDLRVFAGLDESEYEQVNIPFNISAFMEGHDLTLETFDAANGTGWIVAVPRTFSELYSKVRLQINSAEGLIRVMELFMNDVLIERNEVIDVVTIGGMILPKTIRKITYLPLGNYMTDYVFEDIVVNQGLSDGLFFLN